jgi:hypothetical protein
MEENRPVNYRPVLANLGFMLQFTACAMAAPLFGSLQS